MSVRRAGAVVWSVAWAVAIAALSVGMNAHADGDKTSALKQAQESVGRAEQSVRTRMAFAEGLQSQLRLEAEALKAEIREEQRRQGTGADGVRRGGRIDYNLKLLQRLNGYAAQLEARRTELSAWLPCFERYRERIRDEARMLRTLAHADIDALLRDIEAMGREVEERCGVPLITVAPEGRALESLEGSRGQGVEGSRVRTK
jgi:hypothetical protein